MLSRLLALIIIAIIIFLLFVFGFPELADRYGNRVFNNKIREFKAGIEKDPGSSQSLFDTVKNTAKTYVDESKSTVDQIQKTVKKKSQEVKDTVGSLQDAYTAFDKAKGDLEKLTVFSTGSTNTGR